MAIRPAGYYYGGSTLPVTPYKPPKPPPIQYAGPTGFSPGYGPGAVPSSAGYQTFGGSTYALPKLQVQRSVGGDQGGGGGAGGGGGGGGGGGTQTTTTVMTPNPIYESDILSAPESIGGQQAFDATAQQLKNTRMAQFRQALVQSGYDPFQGGALPTDLGDYAGDIDQATRDAAAANQLSDRAQTLKSFNQAQADLPYLLAARGVARSGALATGNTALNEQYQSATNQGLNDLLSTLRGYGSTYAGGYNQAMQALNAARQSAAQRLAQMRGYSQTTTTTGGGEWGGGATPGSDVGYDPSVYENSPGNQELTDFVNSLPPPLHPGTIPYAGGGSLNAIARKLVGGSSGTWNARKVRAG